MKSIFEKLKTEDWVIVFAGIIILIIAIFLPAYMPVMPKALSDGRSWLNAGYMLVFIFLLVSFTHLILKRSLKGMFVSFLCIFLIALAAQIITSVSFIKDLGLESVFFSVLFGLIISNLFTVPQWLKPAVQSEFYIKIGIVVLGSTILFGEVLKSGMFGLIQSVIVVFTVWYFAFWVSRKVFKVDDEMSTMLSSAVSICGVSAAIATSGVIKGDNKKLSYIISLVLVCAIPMMYILPWLSGLMGLSEEVAGAWMGGTIDTTGAVAASGTLLGEKAASTAIIVKSSQNVLLGAAAFIISLYWSYRGKQGSEKTTLGVIWERFPKFVVGFVMASVIFSVCFTLEEAKVIGKITKGFANTFFSIAFVCIGLETRFKDLFNNENRRPLKAFLVAQGFNIIVTLIIAYVLFGIVKG